MIPNVHALLARLKASRRVRVLVGVSIAGLVAPILGLAAASVIVGQYDDRILPGVRVGSADLGGVSLPDARHHIAERYAGLAVGLITIETPTGPATITFKEIGRGPNIEVAVAAAAAVGRSDNLLDRILGLVATASQGRELPLLVKLDHSALADRVRDIVRTTGVAPRDAEVIAVAGNLTVVPAVAGKGLDAVALATDIEARLGDPSAPGALAVAPNYTELPPARTDADARAAAAAGERMATDITLSAGSSTYTVPAATVRTSIAFGPAPGRAYGPLVDVSGLRSDVEGIAGKVNAVAVNATFLTDRTGKPIGVRGGKDGVALNVDRTLEAIEALLVERRDAGATARTVAVVTDPVKPELTTLQARAYLRKMVKVSGWTVRFDPGESNGYGANIRIPARNIAGTVVAPGEIFSFFKAVGPIDEAHGFRQGGVIINGRSQRTGAIGGGICSASTTLFNAALRAGFEIVERRAHYYYINRYPVGLDATVFSNGSTTVDMRWRNDSPYPVIVRGYSTSTTVTFELWTVPDGRKVAPIPARPRIWNVVKAASRIEYVTTLKPGERYQEEYPADGYDTVVRRTVTDASGTVIHQDTFSSHYSKMDGILRIGEPE
jgi:vancomycin resistance protein YoaR